MSTFYAIYHTSCGHVIGVVNEPGLGNRTLQMAGLAQLRSAFRTRVATDDDLAALLRGERCAICAIGQAPA